MGRPRAESVDSAGYEARAEAVHIDLGPKLGRLASLTRESLRMHSAEEHGIDCCLFHDDSAPDAPAIPDVRCEMTPSTSCGSSSPVWQSCSEDHLLDYMSNDGDDDNVPNFAAVPKALFSFGGEVDKTGAGVPECSSQRPAPALVAAPVGSRTAPGSTCVPGCFHWLFSFSSSVKTPARGMRAGSKVDYDLDKLDCVGLLGCGGFGSVTLVTCRITGQTLALKAVSKGLIMQRQLEHTVKNEKAVLRTCRSPFIVQLAATFNREQHVYFLLEAVMGGDLYTVYSRRFLFGSESHARFYAACMVRALEHLHLQRILYRDLKLENMVVDERGYGKLCDFGLSTCLSASETRAYTVCGTPEYMAPEVTSFIGYTCAADWWSLGIVIYEMMVAETPFAAEDPVEIRKNAQRGIEAVPLPEKGSWADVVRGLCRLQPRERLPALAGGTENLERQEWFSEAKFDWGAHAKRSMKAPFIPVVRGPKDLSNFSTGDQDSPQEVCCPCTDNTWDADFEERTGSWLGDA
mmetsp:Transcript_7817/g.22947  ORF Transcript_7817/g.22947 Transcript_7817/m.22947 type:complete len:519 (-) Transcript_7817:160-1716(-)